MFSLTLKKSLFFPRCLVCSRVIWFRGKIGKIKKTVRCPKCGIQYSRSTIKDADSYWWNRVRLNKTWTARSDSNGRIILHTTGLGTRLTRRSK